MSNKEYLQANQSAFKIFIANNFEEFKKDKQYFIQSLEYYAHCFGTGIAIDGTENDIISSSYSVVFVEALFNTSLGIIIDAKTWNKWINERLGMACKK
jgi:hypothetical protein